jgi:hypothetical protein
MPNTLDPGRPPANLDPLSQPLIKTLHPHSPLSAAPTAHRHATAQSKPFIPVSVLSPLNAYSRTLPLRFPEEYIVHVSSEL